MLAYPRLDLYTRDSCYAIQQTVLPLGAAQSWVETMSIQIDDIGFDKAVQKPITEQLVEGISELIRTGQWQAGERLPSVRQLAARLGISKYTVAEVYDRLAAQAWVVTRAGSGVFVRRQSPALTLQDAASEHSLLASEVALMRQTLQRQPDWLKPAAGWLTSDWLPEAEIRTALKDIAREGHSLTDYGPAQGYLPLRQYLSGRLQPLKLTVEPGQLLLTASATQALDLVLRLLFKPGDVIMVDDPGFYNFQAMLRLHQLELLPVARTAEGPDLAHMQALLQQHRVKAYLTNSVLSNPVGTSVQPQRAFAVLELIKKHQLWLIEDDIYADFESSPALRYNSLTGFEQSIYIGSLSKTISADLRVGYIAALPAMIASLTDLKLMTSTSTPTSVERVLYKVLTSAGYQRHLKQLRIRLDEQRQAVLQRFRALDIHPWYVPDGGYALWLQLPNGISAKALAHRMLDRHIVLAPGGHFSQLAQADQFMRVNITQCHEPLWTELAKVLSALHEQANSDASRTIAS